jgi:hypothetical protein
MEPVVKIGTKLSVGVVTSIQKSGVVVDGKLYSFAEIEGIVNDGK